MDRKGDATAIPIGSADHSGFVDLRNVTKHNFVIMDSDLKRIIDPS